MSYSKTAYAKLSRRLNFFDGVTAYMLSDMRHLRLLKADIDQCRADMAAHVCDGYCGCGYMGECYLEHELDNRITRYANAVIAAYHHEQIRRRVADRAIVAIDNYANIEADYSRAYKPLNVKWQSATRNLSALRKELATLAICCPGHANWRNKGDNHGND